MNFERLLLKAKEGNADAVLKILEIYKLFATKKHVLSSLSSLCSCLIAQINTIRQEGLIENRQSFPVSLL